MEVKKLKKLLTTNVADEVTVNCCDSVNDKDNNIDETAISTISQTDESQVDDIEKEPKKGEEDQI
ncbi:hypothetical protein J6590_090602 [Homalodisca vitripennis]|nr:hypothetical protein J6590_090602 [Homalodisca vitripennis]